MSDVIEPNHLMPSTSPVRTGILVCTLLGCSKTDGAKSPSDFAEAPHQPSANVSWSAKLFELFAPIAIDVKDSSSLNPQLDREWEDSFTVTNGSQTTNVTTCRSLLDLADGYEPAAPEFEVFQGRKARCWLWLSSRAPGRPRIASSVASCWMVKLQNGFRRVLR